MEHHPSDQTKILSMNISCCEACPVKLKKKLLKMHGVDSVTTDTERNLVFVTGTIDAMALVSYVAKLGKRVELLPTEKHGSKSKSHHVHFDEIHKDSHRHECPSKEDSSYYSTAHRQRRREPVKNRSYQDPRRNIPEEEKKREEEHKCEAYVAPTVDERTCRDYFCKIHPRSRKIVDQVPSDGHSSFFGGLGFNNFGGGGMDPYGGPYLHQGWHPEVPPRFGYHGQPPRMLPRPFGGFY